MIRHLLAVCSLFALIGIGCVANVSDDGGEQEGDDASSEPVAEAESGCCCAIMYTDTQYSYSKCNEFNACSNRKLRIKWEATCATCYGCGEYKAVEYMCVAC